LEELCERISASFEARTFDREELINLLNELEQVLRFAPTRFVDIDPTTLETNFLLQEVVENLSAEVESESLLQIYEAVKIYLVVRNKYGEAADWYLKDEFETHLKEKLLKFCF